MNFVPYNYIIRHMAVLHLWYNRIYIINIQINPLIEIVYILLNKNKVAAKG